MSGIRPSTRFSGSSNPDAQNDPDAGWGRLVFALIIFVFAPIPLLVGLGIYILFQFARISYKVFWVAVGVYWLLFLGVFGFSTRPWVNYLTPYWDLLSMLENRDFSFPIFYWIGMQFAVGVGLGLIAGTLYSWYRWIRRPVWEEAIVLRRTPWEWARRRRTIRKIAKDEDAPTDGMTIGVTPDGRRLVQTDIEAAAHAFMCGSSGSGKTSTLLIHARDAIKRGHGYVYVDLKGGVDVPEKLAEFAERYGRRFMHFVIQDSRLPYDGPADGPSFYDPAGRGDPSRRKDLLIGAKPWDVEYYKQVVANYLQTAFRVSALVPPQQGVGSFEDLVVLLQPDRLADRAARIPVTHPDYPVLYAEVDRLVNGSEAQERSGVRSMLAYIQTFVGSTAGAWLRKDPSGKRDIDFRRVADEGWVVCFSLDSSNYGESSAAIAGLVVQDLKTLSSELRMNPAPKPMNIILDEFQAIESDNVLGLIDKCRDANMPVIMSTQAIGNLAAIDDSFVDRVIGIVNCFMIHRANSMADAEIYAGLTGMEKKYKKMLEVEHRSSLPGGSIGYGAATGGGRVEEYDEFRVMPHQILELGRGQMVYVAKSPNMRVVYPVDVVLENPNLITALHPDSFARNTRDEDNGQDYEVPTYGYEQHDVEVPVEDEFTFRPDPQARQAAEDARREEMNLALGEAITAINRAPDTGRRAQKGQPLTMWGDETAIEEALASLPDPSQPASQYDRYQQPVSSEQSEPAQPIAQEEEHYDPFLDSEWPNGMQVQQPPVQELPSRPAPPVPQQPPAQRSPVQPQAPAQQPAQGQRPPRQAPPRSAQPQAPVQPPAQPQQQPAQQPPRRPSRLVRGGQPPTQQPGTGGLKPVERGGLPSAPPASSRPGNSGGKLPTPPPPATRNTGPIKRQSPSDAPKPEKKNDGGSVFDSIPDPSDG